MGTCVCECVCAGKSCVYMCKRQQLTMKGFLLLFFRGEMRRGEGY